MKDDPVSAPKPWTLEDTPKYQAAMRFLGYDLGYWFYVKRILQKTNMLEELERGYIKFKEKK